VTISPAIFVSCYDCPIGSEEVSFVRIQETISPVCRRTNNYFVALSMKKSVVF
jgi:hypothetical protein